MGSILGETISVWDTVVKRKPKKGATVVPILFEQSGIDRQSGVARSNVDAYETLESKREKPPEQITQLQARQQERTLSPRRGLEGLLGEGVSEEEEAVRSYVAQARTGDKDAFRRLVETYQQRIYAVAFGVIGNPQDAEDIVQDAFVKAYRKLDTFKGQSSFYTWLYRITFNLSVDLSRKRYRHRELLFGDQRGIEIGVGVGVDGKRDSQALTDRLNDPEREFHRSQLRDGIRDALRDLSPEHRAVITLREIDGLSYSEISDAIGVSKGTVMSRLHHARRKLQRTLSQFLQNDQTPVEPVRIAAASAHGSTVKAS